MTARDEAISSQRFVIHLEGFTDNYLGRLIDAIPPDVLARLAIERGGLVEASTARPTSFPVYRLVTDES